MTFIVTPLRKLSGTPAQARNYACCLLIFLASSITACSDSDSSAYPHWWGPSSDLSEEITGSNAAFIGSALVLDLSSAGYVEEEFVAAGTASSYTNVEPLTEDGRWSFEEDLSADYRTRVIVRRPVNASDFSGS